MTWNPNMDEAPRETDSTGNGPICPYCGAENDSTGSDYWAETQGDGDTDCDTCGRTFRFEVDYTTHYYGFPLPAPPKIKD